MLRNSKTKKNRLKLFLINAAIIGIVIASFSLMRGNNKIVTVGSLAVNVRTEATPTSPIVTQVHKEDKVTIHEKKDGWYKITTADKAEGWVADWLLFEGTSSPYTNLPAQINQKTNLLEKPSQKSKAIKTLKRQEKITVTLEKNGWVLIDAKGDTGWIPANHISIRKNQQPTFDIKQKVHVAIDSANLQANPHEFGNDTEELEYGEEITILSKTDKDWYHVSDVQGHKGYLAPWELTERDISSQDKRPNKPMSEFTVMLDPGHGGNDPGANTNDGRILEKDLTLQTAQTVKKELEKNGYNVLMTRDKDELIELSDIAKLSSTSDADAFVSFHYDSSGIANEGSGTTTFYHQDNGKALAQAVNDSIAYLLPLQNRGFANQDYQVLRENTKPSVLLELGYINNDSDATYAQSPEYHEQVAKAVTLGLTDYFNQLENNQKK